MRETTKIIHPYNRHLHVVQILVLFERRRKNNNYALHYASNHNTLK